MVDSTNPFDSLYTGYNPDEVEEEDFNPFNGLEESVKPPPPPAEPRKLNRYYDDASKRYYLHDPVTNTTNWEDQPAPPKPALATLIGVKKEELTKFRVNEEVAAYEKTIKEYGDRGIFLDSAVDLTADEKANFPPIEWEKHTCLKKIKILKMKENNLKRKREMAEVRRRQVAAMQKRIDDYQKEVGLLIEKIRALEADSDF